MANHGDSGELAESISDGGHLQLRRETPAILPELLQQAAVTSNGIIYWQRNGKDMVQSYAELLQIASCILAGLRQSRLQPGTLAVLLLEQNRDIIPAFWGCILGGLIPIIMEVPSTYTESNPALEKLSHVCQFLDYPPIVTTLAGQKALHSLPFSPPVYAIENLKDNSPDRSYHPSQPEDLALLTLSSGSTGMPKCIQLTHRNLIARAIGANILNQHQANDIAFNWLPFDHIGSISDWHIRCLALGCQVIYAPKEYILSRPLNWLDLIDKYRVTHSWAPNFAYALVKDLLTREPQQNWDLSCVKFLLTAGEAIGYETVVEVRERLGVYGLNQTAIRPAFGMAELASGITYYQPDRDFLVKPSLSSNKYSSSHTYEVQFLNLSFGAQL